MSNFARNVDFELIRATDALVTEAKALNVSESKTVRMTVHRTALPGTAGVQSIARTVIAGYQEPAFSSSDMLFLDMNPSSTDYGKLKYSTDTGFTTSLSFNDYFGISGSGGSSVGGYAGVTGTGDGSLVLGRDPSSPMEASTKGYVDATVATLVTALTQADPLPPTQDISTLMAIDTTGLPDKKLVYVEAVSSLYTFNPASTLEADGDDIVEALGGGRWIKVTDTSVDGGQF
jgi:hypothetical protein